MISRVSKSADRKMNKSHKYVNGPKSRSQRIHLGGEFSENRQKKGNSHRTDLQIEEYGGYRDRIVMSDILCQMPIKVFRLLL